MSNNSGSVQSITTLQNDAFRASYEGLTGGTYLPGELYKYYEANKPVTVEGVVAVFPTQNNFFELYPIVVGGNNYTGVFYLSLWRKVTGIRKFAITGISKAAPGVVAVSEAHNYSTNDRVLLADIVGMTELNGKDVTITQVTGTTFSIGIDTSNYTAYSSGGRVTNEKIRTGWFRRFVGRFQFVCSGIVGVADTPVRSDERFVDTISASGNYDDSRVRQIWSPSTILAETPASLLVDGTGCQLGMIEPDLGGGAGTPVTSMNALITTL